MEIFNRETLKPLSAGMLKLSACVREFWGAGGGSEYILMAYLRLIRLLQWHCSASGRIVQTLHGSLGQDWDLAIHTSSSDWDPYAGKWKSCTEIKKQNLGCMQIISTFLFNIVLCVSLHLFFNYYLKLKSILIIILFLSLCCRQADTECGQWVNVKIKAWWMYSRHVFCFYFV